MDHSILNHFESKLAVTHLYAWDKHEQVGHTFHRL